MHSLEVGPALLKTWPHHLYSLLGYDNAWDFENDNAYGGDLKAELGRGFGSRQQWVGYVGVDVPLVRAGQDNFTVEAGLNYVFK